MLKNYLVIAWRNALRHKLYSSINIIGLGIGIAFCLLMLLFVRHEWTYDSFHQHADDIYQVVVTFAWDEKNEKQTIYSPHPLAKVLKEEIPEIVQTVRFSGKRLDQELTPGDIHVRYGDKLFMEEVMFADATFSETFSFSLQEGDFSTAFKDPGAVVLSQEMARKYFGDKNPLHKRLSFRSARSNAWYDFTVAGVVEEIPGNSTIRFDFLLPYERISELFSASTADSWERWEAVTFIQLTAGTPIKVVEGKLDALVQSDKIPPVYGLYGEEFRFVHFALQPLTDMHLNSDIPTPRIPGIEPESDPVYSYLLAGISLLVLGMACINFTNLGIARSTTRAREVGVRKVVGARRRQLIGQFGGEAILLSLIGLVGGVALAEFFLPIYNGLVGKDLLLEWNASLLGALVGLSLLVGLVAGSYPALVLSGFHPVEVLKGRLRGSGTSLFGRGLVMVQFMLSIALAISAVVMMRQLHFIQTRDLGFNKEQVVLINTEAPGESQRAALRNSLLQHSHVVNVAMVRYPLEYFQKDEVGLSDGRPLDIRKLLVGYDLLETLEMDLVEGRDFSRGLGTDVTESIIINQTLASQIGRDEVVGQMIELDGRPRQIIGVVEDFYFESLHHQVSPTVLVLNPELADGVENGRLFVVRIKSDDIPGTLAYMEDKWNEIASYGKVFQYSFLNENIERFYREERRWGRMITYSSLFAIFIACLGAFGITSIVVTQRTKEIGIRKVLGASVPSIAALLSSEFFRLVLVANAMAWPLAYLAMDRWLQDFAYRIDLGIEELALGGALTLLLIMTTVISQAIKAAFSNPVDALRYE